MSTRMTERFALLKQEGRAALVTFTMAFDPDRVVCLEMLKQLSATGVDVIELGVPFSDPMADGPIIQKAGIRGLKSGATLAGVLGIVKEFRQYDNVTPIVLMGYYNPIQRFGIEQFTSQANDCGIDGVIIVDLPPEEDDELFAALKQKELCLIKLVTPTTNQERLSTVLSKASGFIYYVAVTGVTGTASAETGKLKSAVSKTKASTSLPVAVGFGIKTAQDVSEIADFADAVVVGSRLVEILHQEGQDQAVRFVESLVQAARS